jgi:hypothetical protein
MQRTATRLVTEPCDDKTPPRAFNLIRETEKQVRGSRGIWQRDSALADSLVRETLITLTRRQLARHIADAAGELACVDDGYDQSFAEEEMDG